MTEEEVKTKEQNEANEKIMAELSSAYKRLFNCNDGKIVLEDLSKICGNKVSSALPSFDSNRTFFHEGMRNVYLYINQKIERNKEKENG
jgi:hypothetical protein